jgi:hypothetical protein
MFMVNTYRWDYPQVAALIAPRPLLIANTDSDGIFPLDGVHRTFDQVRRIYRLYDTEKKGTSANVALAIAAGPHKDTQELQTNEFRWFNHYLKNDDSPIDSRAPKYFEPEQLKVFAKLPVDQINTKIHETFVAKAAHPIPATKLEAEETIGACWSAVHEKLFNGWPSDEPMVNLLDLTPFTNDGRLYSFVHDGIKFDLYQFASQNCFSKGETALYLYVLRNAKLEPPKNRPHVDALRWRWTATLRAWNTAIPDQEGRD